MINKWLKKNRMKKSGKRKKQMKEGMAASRLRMGGRTMGYQGKVQREMEIVRRMWNMLMMRSWSKWINRRMFMVMRSLMSSGR